MRAIGRFRAVALLGMVLVVLPIPSVASAQHPDRSSDPPGSGGRDATAVVREDFRGRRPRDLALWGRGERLVAATADVWVHGHHAYLGTSGQPCGTGEHFAAGVAAVDLVHDVDAPGVVVFDVRHPRRPRYVGNLPSVAGSSIDDVKVASLNSGDVLVHSNEGCEGGPGGIELYDVDDPRTPVHLASVRMRELNPIADGLLGGVTDLATSSAWPFSQGRRDYVAVNAVHAWGNFDTFRVFDITDPTAPRLVTAWGPEELFDPGVGDLVEPTPEDVDRVLAALQDLAVGGFGGSPVKRAMDVAISADGTMAYVPGWDAGLVLLDLGDLSAIDGVTLPNDRVVSVAVDVDHGSLDGEVNSVRAWPSEDGSIVVETESDFSAWERVVPPQSIQFSLGDPPAPVPGVGIATVAGDALEAEPTGNTATVDADSLTVTAGPLAGSTFGVTEATGDQPTFADTGPVTGEAVFIGRACAGDDLLNTEAFDAGDLAVVRRGGCTFREKNFTAATVDAGAVVIANNVQTSTPWGGVRIWDYSRPHDPVLASTYYTACAAATEPVGTCDPAGIYTAADVLVRSRGGRVYAYVAWHRDGVVVLDVTDPYEPELVARFKDESPEFIAANGGDPHAFLGLHSLSREPWIFGSDYNGGLSVFKLGGRAPAPG